MDGHVARPRMSTAGRPEMSERGGAYMYFGSPVWPFQWHPPYDQVVRRLAGLGCRGVELIAWTPQVLHDYYTPRRIRDLRDLIGGAGVRLTNFHHNPEFLSSPDASVRAQAGDDFARAIEVAAALGSPTVTMVTPYPFSRPVPRLLSRPTLQEWQAPVERGLNWTQNYDDYVRALAACCTRAAQAGLRVALEPHPYRWMHSAQSMLRLVERTGATNLGLNLDPSHLFPSGDIPHYTVYLLGSRVYHTHFSDNDGQSNAHWRPGKGKVDWTALLRALADVGYDDVISLELEDVPGVATKEQQSTPELDREMRIAMAGRSLGCQFGDLAFYVMPMQGPGHREPLICAMR
jgi:sugar phosphate isomerase/epimerase